MGEFLPLGEKRAGYYSRLRGAKFIKQELLLCATNKRDEGCC